MKTGLRHSDYIKLLLEKRKEEIRQIDPIHERGDRFTSPPGATSLEENRIITEYMEQRNLHKVINSIPEIKKPILLKKFFKMKRNQQVIIYTNYIAEIMEVTGKVSAVGRDFVMLTNLKNRIWIPYTAIESANIPAGVPNYDNSHQYFIYDNDLKRKLTTDFGETVAKRNVLVQQFFEESLMTNLNNLAGIWVKVVTQGETYFGKISSVSENRLTLGKTSKQMQIDSKSVIQITSLRLLQRLSMVGKNLLMRFV